jgi:hypothetical protein
MTGELGLNTHQLPPRCPGGEARRKPVDDDGDGRDDAEKKRDRIQPHGSDEDPPTLHLQS